MKIKANGITFNYDVTGIDGAPWLIFSNSLATNLHMWDQQAADLRNLFRILRYDQRGHGQTEAPAGRYTFELLVADVIALMDALGVARAHWCGVSMGCATGMGLVQKHPGRFDRMVLCDNPGRSSPETLKANPPHMDIIRRMILATPVNGFIGCSTALGDHDFRPLMPQVKNPVLYMTGEKDGHNAAAMKVMQQELPGSQYIVLPGAGHISNMDQPAMFTKSLREFLAA